MYSHLFDLKIKAHPYLKRARQILGAFLLLGLIAACSTPKQTLEIRNNPPDISSLRELIETPFFPQTEYHCGPAALATVIQYHGISASSEKIVPLIYTPGLKGALQIEVVAATRQFDLLPVKLDGKLESLLREIDDGNPVLVLQNLGLDNIPFWHYAVVVGYDLDNQSIVLRSGTNKRLVRPFDNFERTWQRGDYWALVIVPPERIPVTASAEDYLQAVIELEQTGHVRPAHLAYSSAIEKWPKNVLAYTGLANSAFAMGNYSLSEQVYQQALALSPDSHQLWNNLAYAQAKLGRHNESLRSINKALVLSPDNPNYLDSLRELKAGLPDN
jgi:hypothetical protein